uniref:Uncharacterized protein n=1 Tax=Sphaerodactylus townsendi TaxID=933632 RepID=A0ACB8FFY8_9SAUR
MAEKLSIRKRRFMQFASLQYDGEYYMTPRDFLLSVMFDKPGRKTLAKKLTKKEVDATLGNVAKAKPGATFFRDLGDKDESNSDYSSWFVADEEMETKSDLLHRIPVFANDTHKRKTSPFQHNPTKETSATSRPLECQTAW